MECVNKCGEMSHLVYEKQQINICETCAGVWLDSFDLSSILQSHQLQWTEELIGRVMKQIEDLEVEESEFSRELACPVCDGNLPPENFRGNSNIIINPCSEGHGVWLDAGELVKVQIYIENRNAGGR